MSLALSTLGNTIAIICLLGAMLCLIRINKNQMKVNRQVAKKITNIENELFKLILKGKTK